MGDVLIVILAVVCLWAVIPGWGPDLANLPGLGLSCGRDLPADSPAHQAHQELCRLDVRQHQGATGYERSAFGEGWADLDGDGCNTRTEILARDMENPVHDPHNRCRIIGGDFNDPYTANTLHFTQPPGAKIQIDHVVALGDAWASGANTWTDSQRLRYANDPRVLLAVDGKANQNKGKASADSWLPQNRAYRCAYARQQIHIKFVWNLSVTSAERAALLAALRHC